MKMIFMLSSFSLRYEWFSSNHTFETLIFFIFWNRFTRIIPYSAHYVNKAAFKVWRNMGVYDKKPPMAKLFCHRRLLDFQILFAFSNSQRLRIFLIKTIAMISAKITTARIITCDIVVVMGTPPVYARFSGSYSTGMYQVSKAAFAVSQLLSLSSSSSSSFLEIRYIHINPVINSRTARAHSTPVFGRPG